MEFKKIISGRNKVQILHQGFRMQRNQGPRGPHNLTYFNCTEPNCKAKLTTEGLLDGELKLKYHHVDQHTHPPDPSEMIVKASLSEFRARVKSNPECSAKNVFDEIANEALDSVSTPNKLDLAKKLPTYRTGKHKQLIIYY